MITLTNARTADGIATVQLDSGRIVAITPVRAGAGSTAGSVAGDTIDLDGRWLLPGLWDHHVHLNQLALALRRVDLSHATSAAEVVSIMGGHAASAGQWDGHPLVGHGFRDGLWTDAPSAELLDSAVGVVPTVLVSGDLHCVWLNTAALAMYGLSGHPTGVLREDDCFEIVGSLQDIPDSTLDEWVSDAAADVARRGVVGVLDMEMAPNIDVWTRRASNGFNALRVRAGIYTEYLDAAIEAGFRTGDPLAASELISVGGFKILIDGSLNTRTAFCLHEYPDTQEHGVLTVPTDELIALLRKASAAGIVPTVHAIGDDANRLALDAFETVGCRGQIEHAQLLRDEDIARFAALGIAASVQPEHAMDDRDVADRYWAGRTSRAFPLRSLLDAGATLLLGSDAPVAPLDPWVTMSAAVFRSRDGREPWHPEQSITLAEALAASTHSTVHVGQVADLIAVDRDPETASAGELRTMPVALTMVAGRATHRAL